MAPARAETPAWAFVVLWVLALAFLSFRLSEVPVTWYDEGLNLNAVRTLLDQHVFGLTTAEGVRVGDPSIQTGTPVLLPLALLTAWTGPSLWMARLFTVVCSLAAIVVFAALVARMYGRFAAFVALSALLALPGDSTATFLTLGRQVLGEIPAMLCVSAALLLLTDRRDSHGRSLLVGVLFGLAVLVKSQVLLILTATNGLWALFGLLRQTSDRWHRLIVLGVMLAIFAGDSVWKQSAAGSQLAQNAATLWEGVFIHLLPFRVLSNLAEKGVVFRLAFVLAIVAATLALRQRTSGRASPEVRRTEDFLLVFVTIWIVWFGVASIGWRRYAFMGLVFSLPLLGHLLDTMRREWRVSIRPRTVLAVLALVAVALLIQGRSFFHAQAGNDFDTVAAYVRDNVPAEATILSWDWSLSYVRPGRYAFPSTRATWVYTATLFLNRAPEQAAYDMLTSCPDYVLVNDRFLPESLQPAVDVSVQPPLIETGRYKLFRVDPAQLVRRTDGTCGHR